jgi:hypothetical protein
VTGGLMIAAAFRLHLDHGRWFLAIGPEGDGVAAHPVGQDEERQDRAGDQHDREQHRQRASTSWSACWPS